VKNLSYILNIILFVAVAILYYFHFSSNKTEVANDVVGIDSVSTKSSLKIAYVVSDTLLSNYDYFKIKSKELEAEKKKMEDDMGRRAKGLEREVVDFQRTAGSLTINQAKALEENLYKKRENLMKRQEGLAQTLMQKEAAINNKLYENVTNFLEEYGKDNNLEVVLSHQRGSGLLYAHKGLDITQVVIEGLNKAYQESLKINTDSTESK